MKMYTAEITKKMQDFYKNLSEKIRDIIQL